MPKVGDIVRYLNSVGGGRIVRIKDNMAFVDDDGFETPVLLKECVVVRSAEDEAKTAKATEKEKFHLPSPSVSSSQTTKPEKFVESVPIYEETPEGEKLNIVLGIEPTDRLRLSQSDFDASLINDSNFFLYFVLSSRETDSDQWTCRYAGMLEPNTELWLGTFPRSEIIHFDNLSFQYLAFKNTKEFDLKEPAIVKFKVDTTKFFKLHCYHKNPYFEHEVIAFTIVENDCPNVKKPVNIEILKTAYSKSGPDVTSKTENNNTKYIKKGERVAPENPLVIDLHIDALVDTTAGMTSADMLNLQIDTFQRIMNENLRNFGKKIIFIHGKGEGVLRQALTKELNNRYKGHDVQDASFQEYGYGATQVTIRQHPDKFNKKARR